jgi:hypothetical protein
LLTDLNRRANTTDKIWAQNLAVLVWRAEQIEAIGRDTTELRRLIDQSMACRRTEAGAGEACRSFHAEMLRLATPEAS